MRVTVRNVRNEESSLATIAKKTILPYALSTKIMREINIFASPSSSMTARYDAAGFLHGEFSTKTMPLAILSKTLTLITGIFVQQEVSQKWLIWPATKILHGIILFQKNSRALNVVIGDLIPLVCNVLIPKFEIPSAEFDMFIAFLSAFCIKHVPARQKVRGTSFPSSFIDLLGKKQISINEFKYAGALLSIMDENDKGFDFVVPDQQMLFTVFEDLLNPTNNPMVLKTAFLIFNFYFSRQIPQRIEKLVQHDQLIVNLFQFLTAPLLDEEIRITALQSMLYIITSSNRRISGKFLELGFVEKLNLAYNFLERKYFISYLGEFMEYSEELRYALLKDGELISYGIMGCYSYEDKDAEACVTCILRLLSILPNPLRSDLASCGAHNAITENIDRFQSSASINGLLTYSANTVMLQYFKNRF